MATQTVTVSRAPANGDAHSSGVPAATGTVDYSLTDLDLLESPNAPETAPAEPAGPAIDGAAPTAAPGKGTGAGEKPAEQSEYSDARFDSVFALPGVGPRLKEICERESAYRAVFATVADARAIRDVFPSADQARAAAAAQTQLAHLDRIVESRDPRAHAELLADLQRNAPEAFRALALTFSERLATLDPEAFRSVAAVIAAQAGNLPARAGAAAAPVADAAGRTEGRLDSLPRSIGAGATSAPAAAAAGQFLEAVNTDVEQAVRQSVGRKVEELLPDAPEGARQKIAGEIFRELDLALRRDPELLDHVRECVNNALRAAAGDPRGAQSSAQRESVARLIAGRARAALPGVARRVVADWTETVLRSTQARRARQSESASRVEVGRGGAPGPVPLRPRGVDYTRMSDEEILNMD